MLTRYLVGFAFIPSGLVKLYGHRFTQLDTSDPVGFFFEGLYQSGFYWNFLGFAQVFTALLLMTQRFATLGAIFYFFIITNIWLITVSVGFAGTWIITSLMFLAGLLFLGWDYYKLRPIFYSDSFVSEAQYRDFPTYSKWWIIVGIILFLGSVGLCSSFAQQV